MNDSVDGRRLAPYLTPFVMPQYKRAAATQANQLDPNAEGLGTDPLIHRL
jgi:hypothetical protein